LQAVFRIDDLLGVESANAHHPDRVALEGGDLFDPAVDQVDVDAAAAGANAAYAGHGLLLAFVRVAHHYLKPLIKPLFKNP
jgi:hypothetical protein